MTNPVLPEPVAALIKAQSAYAAVQASTDAVLAEAQLRGETAMRRVAALGLSHRRIGDLTGLSHTRVNQILGTGTKRPPDDIHFPPGFLPPPTTVVLAALRVIAEEGPRTWRVHGIADETARARMASRGARCGPHRARDRRRTPVGGRRLLHTPRIRISRSDRSDARPRPKLIQRLLAIAEPEPDPGPRGLTWKERPNRSDEPRESGSEIVAPSRRSSSSGMLPRTLVEILCHP
jgi:hypothetical protein